MNQCIEVLQLLNDQNPNKLSIIDELALRFISSEATFNINYLNNYRNPKTQDQKDILKLDLKLDAMTSILSVTKDLQSSLLLKPINGLVIHKNRTRNNNLINSVKTITENLKSMESA